MAKKSSSPRRPESLSRRDFGKAIGLAGVAQAPVLATLADRPLTNERPEDTAPPTQAATQTAPARTAANAYTFFTADEAAFVDAAVDRLIPADSLGPGARECGVTVFIDRQLSGTFGSAGKWYMQGPWGESTPEQGYQLPLTPRQLYRLCIAEVDRHLAAQRGKPFRQLAEDERDAVLRSMETGALAIESVPLQAFFDMLLGNAREGFFADPIYGGNRDKAGWRLVGFPGVAASYLDHIGRYNEPYRVEPVGIEDVVEGRARQDEHGHVLHEPLGQAPAARTGGR